MADFDFGNIDFQKFLKEMEINRLNQQTTPKLLGMAETVKSPPSPYPGAPPPPPDESVGSNLGRALQGDTQKNPDAKLGEGVGGTAGGLVGSIWGPIGQMVGKKVGTEVGGGIQEAFTSKHPWTDLSHRFIYGPLLAEPMKLAKNPMSALGGDKSSTPTGGGGTEGLKAYDQPNSPYGDFGFGSYKPGMFTGDTGGGGITSLLGGGGGAGGGVTDLFSSMGGEGAGAAGGLGSIFSGAASSGAGFS